MIDLVLPKLPDGFAQFGVCAIIEAHDEKVVRWVRKHSLDDAVAEFRDQDGEQRWLEVNIDTRDDESVHLHVEISREKLKSKDKPRNIEELVKSITSFLDKVGGERVVMSRARIPVHRSEIPANGTIGRLLSFSSESCGAKFSVQGASLDIEDDAFSRLTFNYREKDQKVYVELWAISMVDFDREYLACLAELMETGAECYVYERITREPSHA